MDRLKIFTQTDQFIDNMRMYDVFRLMVRATPQIGEEYYDYAKLKPDAEGNARFAGLEFNIKSENSDFILTNRSQQITLGPGQTVSVLSANKVEIIIRNSNKFLEYSQNSKIII